MHFLVNSRKKEDKFRRSRSIFFKKNTHMQIKLFTIPVGDSGSAVAEMNAFLRGNKILEVEHF